MRLTIERWGFDLRVSGCILRLVPGDTFIRLPRVGQLAWNHTGIYADRLKKGSIPDPIA
jgi:hypothetical protein